VADLSLESIHDLESILLYAVEHLHDIDCWPDCGRYEETNKHRLWDTLRELKGVSCMASIPGYLAIPVMRRVLAGRGLALTALGYESDDDAIDDLEALWDRVKMAANEDPLDAAVRNSELHPVGFATNRLSPAYHRFLNVGYQMQLLRGSAPIALPQERLSEVLGVSQKRVSDFCQFAKQEKFLDPVNRCNRERHLAATFFFRWQGKVVE
jgi:hypothetical protein